MAEIANILVQLEAMGCKDIATIKTILEVMQDPDPQVRERVLRGNVCFICLVIDYLFFISNSYKLEPFSFGFVFVFAFVFLFLSSVLSLFCFECVFVFVFVLSFLLCLFLFGGRGRVQ